MTNYLLPAITAVLCGTFLVIQQVSLSKVSERTTKLQTRIARAEGPGLRPPTLSSGPAAAATKSGRQPSSTLGSVSEEGEGETVADVDLEALVREIMEAQATGGPDMAVMIRVKSLMLRATPEELADLLERVAAVEAPARIKEELMGEIVATLAEHDPQRALDIALETSGLEISRQRWRFAQAFSKWADEEPLVAAAWFDQQQAEGHFESKSLSGGNQVVTEFESALVGKLLAEHPEQARARLEALPSGKRAEVLANEQHLRVSTENAAAFGELVRDTIDEEQRGYVFASAAKRLVREGGFDEVRQLANGIQASAEERTAIAERAAVHQIERMGWQRRDISTDDLAEMQEFLRVETPEEAARITGESLASYGRNNNNFTSAVEVVRELHEASPDDELVKSFLTSANVQSESKEAARELAAIIQDPEARQEILDKLK